MAKARKKAVAVASKARSKVAQVKSRPKPKPKAKTRKIARVAAAKTSARTTKLPRYDDLPVRAGAPKGAAWGVFGDTDELGTINLMTAECVIKAAAEIRTGRVFSLNLPLNLPDPPLYGRGVMRHHIFPLPLADFFTDDYLDNFYPQASSQWDAVGHIKHPVHGHYNGMPEREVTGRGGGGTHLGIENLARRGIAGRGVLADVARFMERRGKIIDCNSGHVISLKDLEATLAEQKTKIRPGDILLVRVGWVKSYLASSPEVRAEVAQRPDAPGVEATTDVARWLWDNHIAAVASDSPAFEAVNTQAMGEMLHPHLLAFFGMPIGEMWDFESLADDCAADKRYSFFLTSAPLNIPGGVGSPPNALAIK
jgi:kynurenine formamidase